MIRFEDMGDPDSALEIFLRFVSCDLSCDLLIIRLGDVEVFDLIRKKNLHAALIDNIEYLMNLGEKVMSYDAISQSHDLTLVSIATAKNRRTLSGISS